jgi:hypothetical protein
MAKRKIGGTVMLHGLGAYNAKGWRAAMAKNPHGARWGKISYHVYRSAHGSKAGYCAKASGTGQRRAAGGYDRRNEGEACAATAKQAVIKAVSSYLKAGAMKRRGRARINNWRG